MARIELCELGSQELGPETPQNQRPDSAQKVWAADEDEDDDDNDDLSL